jgi:acetolactate decarboxylase
MLDERLIHSLHVTAGRRGEQAGAAAASHEVFQASTVAALLDGAYDGDVSFAELARYGDLGLGTFDAVDGEMIALDGEFWRADYDGVAHPVEPERRTPFAVVVRFQPRHRFELSEPLGHEALIAELDRRLGHPEQVHAVRIDGRFTRVRARSVARQAKPYRPLTEVVGDQHVFELGELEGSVVGFRFPDATEGLNVPGYHLHFISADRSRAGHVLECDTAGVAVAADDETEVRLELPAGVVLGGSASAGAIDRVEHEG